MNPSTTNFDELTTNWTSGDNIYGSECHFSDTSPNTIFEISFSNASNRFFDELLKNNPSSNSPQPKYNISKWKDIENISAGSKCTSIKQRTLNIESTETGIAFFLRKNIFTNIHQTAFFHKDSITIYSVAQTQTETKEHDHFVIDRWIINASEDAREPTVAVSINANIIWKSYRTPTATIIKSKWFRFYQSRFETWRKLMTQSIEKYHLQSGNIDIIKPFLGVWNKLNSTHSITIMRDQIEYSDGSQFGVSVNSKTNEIIAIYARSKFRGKLHKHDSFDEIRWNNGSVWIRDGFIRFAGEYIRNDLQYKYVMSASGCITLPPDGRKVKYKLCKANQISYTLHKNVTYKGTICRNKENQQIITWDNGSIWRQINKIESLEIAAAAAAIDEKAEEIAPAMNSNKKTAEIEGETEEFDEHDFGLCLKGSKPSIQVDHQHHFVLVDNDEIFGIQCDDDNDNDEDRDNLNEWLFV